MVGEERMKRVDTLKEPGPGRRGERQRGHFKVGQLRRDKQENTQIPLK